MIDFNLDLSGFIEETALRRNVKFNDWRNLLYLFSNLLRIEEVCYLWIEGSKYLENFKTIFNSNFISINEILEFFKKNINLKDHSFYSAMKSFKKEIHNEEIQKDEMLFFSEMLNFLMRFIQDEKIYKIKNKSISLQIMVFEFFDVAIEKFQNHANENNIMGFVKTFLI